MLTVVNPGVVAVGETTYDLDELSALLTKAHAGYANQGVMIRGEASLNYQDLADVLSVCDSAGIRNVRLPVRTRDGTGSVPVSMPQRLADSPLHAPGPGYDRPAPRSPDGTVQPALPDASPPEPAIVNDLAQLAGPWLYVIFFAIIFCRDGPGCNAVSAGRLSALRGGCHGRHFRLADQPGPGLRAPDRRGRAGRRGELRRRVLPRPEGLLGEDSWLFNRKHLKEAHEFYERYGGVTIILARFMPIIRTFAPFVAGIGKMSYFKFALYNMTGGIAWVLLFLLQRLVVRRPGDGSEELPSDHFRHHRDLGSSRCGAVSSHPNG